MIIIVSGGIGRSVTGGQAWANLQYLIGLKSLGHEVFYLEDCGEWSAVYSWEAEEMTWDLEYPASYIRQCLEPYGFKDRWIYRAGDQSKGLSIGQFREICAAADLLIIRGIPFITWRPEYELPQRRAFIDVDPGFTQVRLVNNDPAFVETISHSEVLFTLAHRIGLEECPIPTSGRRWVQTVPPVVLSEWPVVEDYNSACSFTSVMRWRSIKDAKHEGSIYGQRDQEFPKFIELPSITCQSFTIALIGGNPQKLRDCGWEVIPGWMPTRTPELYRKFIQDSRAEFSVAKHGYVLSRGGWFSDRSVCYLACGRPVLVQDTGVSDWLPVGKGVLTFGDLSEAVHGIHELNADYEVHRQAARLLTEQYFAAERVLPMLLEAALA